VPPRGPTPAPPPGFRAVERLERPTFTLVRYRAGRPAQVDARQLAALRLQREGPDAGDLRLESAAGEPVVAK
jgi:hypothetical protein